MRPEVVGGGTKTGMMVVGDLGGITGSGSVSMKSFTQA